MREEYIATDAELSGGMPQHLMNCEEFRTNYPREEQMDREDILKTMEDWIREQESGVYTERYLEGNGILEMEAMF